MKKRFHSHRSILTIRNFIVVFLSVFVFLQITLQSNAHTTTQTTAAVSKPGEIYLIRGLANVFSLGMDEMKSELSEMGFKTHIHNHSEWETLVEDIVARSQRNEFSYPLVIVGHSLGAGVAPRMATELGEKGIFVSYVVMFDPVEKTTVGANIAEVVNYYLPKEDNSNIVIADENFTGSIEKIDVKTLKLKANDLNKKPTNNLEVSENETAPQGVTHFNIDHNDELQDTIYAKILEYSNAQTE